MGCIVHGVAKSWTRLSDFDSLTAGTLLLGVVFPLQGLKKSGSSVGPSSFCYESGG